MRLGLELDWCFRIPYLRGKLMPKCQEGTLEHDRLTGRLEVPQAAG